MALTLLACSAVIFVGAATQSLIGFGFGLVSIPVLLILVPEHVPQVVILLATPMLLMTIRRDRHELATTSDLKAMMAMTVVGAGFGYWVVAIVPVAARQAGGGGLVLLLVALHAMRRQRRGRRTIPRAMAAGGTSGALTAITSLGGPPLALYLAGSPPAELRAGMAFGLILGNIASFIAHSLGGRYTLPTFGFAAAFALPMLAGYLLSGRVLHLVTRQRLEAALLIVSTVGATLALRAGVVSLLNA